MLICLCNVTLSYTLSTEHVDTLHTFPDPDSKFKRLSDDVKKTLLLNVDSEMYDQSGSRVHPFQYPDVFAKDVWCIMDVSMKLYVIYSYSK